MPTPILANMQDMIDMFAKHPWWTAVGFLGEAIFMSRFVVQWVSSERLGRSHVPVLFWYLSLLGALVLSVYALWLDSPVFLLGTLLPCVIYFRNLVLIYRPRKGQPAS